jgi:hypothetical protein
MQRDPKLDLGTAIVQILVRIIVRSQSLHNISSEFSLLFQLTESERKILETISTIGCSISLLGITLTVLLYAFFWKQFKSPRAKVLLSLCVAIGFTDIFAILEGVARDSPVSFLAKNIFAMRSWCHVGGSG